MKIRPWRFLMCVGLVFNAMCLFLMWNLLGEKRGCGPAASADGDVILNGVKAAKSQQGELSHCSDYHGSISIPKLTSLKLSDAESNRHLLSKYVTFVLPEFELFENDLEKTIETLHSMFSTASILVITDRAIYPPIKLLSNKEKAVVQVVNLKLGPEANKQTANLERIIKTDYVVTLPDSVRFTSSQQMFEMLKFHLEHPDHITAARMVGETPKCFSLSVNLKQWTLEYQEKALDLVCDALEGNFALILPRKLLVENLAYPLNRPFPYSLFIQTAVRKIQVHIIESIILQQGKALFLDRHNKWKHKSLDHQRKEKIYQEFGIKRLIVGGNTVWYGCNKETPRCFGTIVNDMPEYLFQGRWTPPCCLENLRQTARHVFESLDKCNVRYWLEGGSLLGAARNGDIIPWDYDVDLGIYRDDINKCEPLKHSRKRPHIDRKGFVWQKAIEGDFFRVQFSEVNHLHVDIFPFYPKNGMMTKDFWFKTHRQDVEFPESYLKPLTRINFAGWPALAPNNIPQFLELKFGKGVIENPQYPVPEMLQLAGISNLTTDIT